jgi:hypothetical protein
VLQSSTDKRGVFSQTDNGRPMSTKAQARQTYYSSITKKDPRFYKEELSSPKKIDHTKITFDFLKEDKICLIMD